MGEAVEFTVGERHKGEKGSIDYRNADACELRWRLDDHHLGNLMLKTRTRTASPSDPIEPGIGAIKDPTRRNTLSLLRRYDHASGLASNRDGALAHHHPDTTLGQSIAQQSAQLPSTERVFFGLEDRLDEARVEERSEFRACIRDRRLDITAECPKLAGADIRAPTRNGIQHCESVENRWTIFVDKAAEVKPAAIGGAETTRVMIPSVKSCLVDVRGASEQLVACLQ